MEDDVDNEEVPGEQDDECPLSRVLERQIENEAESLKKKKKKARPLPPIRINLSSCKYEVLRIVQRKLGWREVGDDEDWEVYWTDTSVGIERIMKLTRVQKINHFNGMLELCRKRSMARNLQKIQKVHADHYDFFPKTFILPGDMQELINDLKARGKKQIYILKPDAGCQGRGIRLIQGGKEDVLTKTLAEMNTPNIVAQHYLPKPFLIHGYKFDLRIYALVLSCDPLRVFVYKEGLARICTEKYTKPKASNLNISYIHLTNYAVNKHNEHFVANQGGSGDTENASKLGLQQLADYVNHMGHDWSKVWESIQQLIVKSLISVQPILKNNYRSAVSIDNDGFSCFEVLGYDIMLDEELRPWLIETNHSSSFNIDSPLDLAIKEALITDTLQLVRVDPKLIQKAKRMEKRSVAERLLEPMHRRKPAAGAGATAGAAPGEASSAAAVGMAGGAATSSPVRGVSASAAGAAAAAAAAKDGDADSDADTGKGVEGLFRPKTVEELEAWRADIIRKRDKYEESNLGGYTRIYPSPDPKQQALYEELLRGAAEIYGSAYASKAKKTIDQLSDERKKKEESESGSLKAERARAKALRDKLAQQAVERRKLKAEFQASQQAMAMQPGPGAGMGQGQGYGSWAGTVVTSMAAGNHAASLYGQSAVYPGVAGVDWPGFAIPGILPLGGSPVLQVVSLTSAANSSAASTHTGASAYAMYPDTAVTDGLSSNRLEVFGEYSSEEVGGSTPGVSTAATGYGQAPNPGQGYQAQPGSRPLSAHSALSYGHIPGTGDPDGRSQGLAGRFVDTFASGNGRGGPRVMHQVTDGYQPYSNNAATAATTTNNNTTTGASAPVPFCACRPTSACSVPSPTWTGERHTAGGERRAIGFTQAAPHPDTLAQPSFTPLTPGVGTARQPAHSAYGPFGGPAHHQLSHHPWAHSPAPALPGRPSTAPHPAQPPAAAGSPFGAPVPPAHGACQHRQLGPHGQLHPGRQHHPHAPSPTPPGHTPPGPPHQHGTGRGGGGGSAPHPPHAPGAAGPESVVVAGPSAAATAATHAQHPSGATWVAGRPASVVEGAGGAPGGAPGSLRNKLQPQGEPQPQLYAAAHGGGSGGGGVGGGHTGVAAPGAGWGTAADSAAAAAAAVPSTWGATAGPAAAAGAGPQGARYAVGQQQGAAGGSGGTGHAYTAPGEAPAALMAGQVAPNGPAVSASPTASMIRIPQPPGAGSPVHWLESPGGWDWSSGVYLSGAPLVGTVLGARRSADGRAQSAGTGSAARGRAAVRTTRAATARGMTPLSRSVTAAPRPALSSAPSSATHAGGAGSPFIPASTGLQRDNPGRQQAQQQPAGGLLSAPQYVLDVAGDGRMLSVSARRGGLADGKGAGPGALSAAGAAAVGPTVAHMTGQAIAFRAVHGSSMAGGGSAAGGAGSGVGAAKVSLHRSGSGTALSSVQGAALALVATGAPAPGSAGAGPAALGASMFFAHGRPESPRPGSQSAGAGAAGVAGDAAAPSSGSKVAAARPNAGNMHLWLLDSGDAKRRMAECAALVGGSVLTVTGRKLQG